MPFRPTSRGAQKADGNILPQTVSFVSCDWAHVLTVPSSAVVHLPISPSSRWVECRDFAGGACTKGNRCKFVHADVTNAKKHSVHVSYSWRHETLCNYERLPPGEMLNVLAPNNRPPMDIVRSELVLRTKGSQLRHEHRGPLSHCAHYYFNRVCHRGHDCCFIHMVHVDPTAEDHQRAPPPKTVKVIEDDEAFMESPVSHPLSVACSENDSRTPRDDSPVDHGQNNNNNDVVVYRHNPYGRGVVVIC